MFLKARWINIEDGKTIIRPTLIDINEIKQIVFIEEDKAAELYFKGPVILDKKGSYEYDWTKIVCEDPKKITDLLEQYDLILKRKT